MPERLPEGYYVLFTKEQVHDMVYNVANQIVNFCKGEKIKRIVLVLTLKGSFLFTAALLHAIKSINENLVVRFDVIMIDSYGGNKKAKNKRTVKLPMKKEMIEGEVIVITDDLCDEGGTITTGIEEGERCGASQIKTATLLRKENSAGVVPDFFADIIPSHYWIEGFGLGGGNDGERNRDREDIIYCEM